MKSLIDSLKAAKRVSTPLIAVTTPDQPALAQTIAESLNGGLPVVSWDRGNGYMALNKTAEVVLQELADSLDMDADEIKTATSDPVAAIRTASKLGQVEGQAEKEVVLIAHSFNRFLHDSQVQNELVQLVLNTRDTFKAQGNMLIMLSPDFTFPDEIVHDVILLDDPLPEHEGYATIVRELHDSADLSKPDDEYLKKVTRSVRGLSAFEAEQVLAMSLALNPDAGEIDLAHAWDLKQKAVSKVKGLTMTLDGPDLKDLRGLDQVTGMLNDLWAGPEPPELVVRIDEIDKALAGLGSGGGAGDNTGVTQDLHEQFLTNMEGNEWNGAILVGIRGSGKTVLTESIGAHHNVPTIVMDTGSMKGKHVGESEQAFREAFRTIKSIGGKNVLVLATCNKLDVLPPELLRRFKLQIWYFDLLTDEERSSLWPVYLKKYGHPLDSPLPDDTGWTGAEIRNACEIAYKLNKPVKEVGESYIVPVTKSAPDSVRSLRKQADGTFLSASYPGTYEMSKACDFKPKKSSGRKLALKGAN